MITNDKSPNPLKKTRERAVSQTGGPVSYIMAILFITFILGLLVYANIWIWNEIF